MSGLQWYSFVPVLYILTKFVILFHELIDFLLRYLHDKLCQTCTPLFIFQKFAICRSLLWVATQLNCSNYKSQMMVLNELILLLVVQRCRQLTPYIIFLLWSICSANSVFCFTLYPRLHKRCDLTEQISVLLMEIIFVQQNPLLMWIIFVQQNQDSQHQEI